MLVSDSMGGTAVLKRDLAESTKKECSWGALASEPRLEDEENRLRRENLVVGHMALVRRLAGKFRYSGEPVEDLIQIGNLGLVKAAQKFDEDRGSSFAAFAIPVIVGEIKNYFRDHGWSVKLPRKLQTHKRLVTKTADTLTQTQGRAPNIAEIAQATGISVEEVNQTFELEGMGKPLSLDLEYEPGDGGDATTLMDFLGSVDPEIESLAAVLDLTESVERLNPQEQRVLCLRYLNGLSQTDAAARMGVSQMQVSRLQRSALAKLRDALQGQDPLVC